MIIPPFSRYFFYVLSAVVIIGTFNALFLLPVLLSIFGPTPEIIPFEHENRISTPSPLPSLKLESSNCTKGNGSATFGENNDANFVYSNAQKSNRTPFVPRFIRSYKRGLPTRVLSEVSLSTITEEPNSYQSSAVNTPIPPIRKSVSPASGLCAAAAAAAQQHISPPTPQPHEIVVQPEFVVETTITNNGIVGYNNQQHHFATSVTPTSEVNLELIRTNRIK